MDTVLLGVRLSVDNVTLYNHLDPQLMSYINIVTYPHPAIITMVVYLLLLCNQGRCNNKGTLGMQHS